MKKKIIILNIILLIILPINILAYSNKIIIGGETIGIKVKSNGIYVVGFYEVNNKLIAKNQGFKVGDIIKSIDNIEVNNIDDLSNIIKEDKQYKFKIIRNNKEEDLSLKLEEENNTYKTGLYVKDTIYGSGTMSYIDPNTKVFGSLGHEILETNSNQKFNIEKGNIYKAEVNNIRKSSYNNPGEKNTNIYNEEVLGEIYSNEINGIYGIYEKELNQEKLYDIAKPEEIIKGKAYIETVIEKDKIERFDINVDTIDEGNLTKNIKFTITDKKLLEKTGGIIQGMSGSPIIQNNKIIGAVNYVILNENNKGYGIFITTMLEEGDKILNN